MSQMRDVMLVGGKADGMMVKADYIESELIVTAEQYGAVCGPELNYFVRVLVTSAGLYYFGFMADIEPSRERLKTIVLTRGMRPVI